MWMKFKSLPNMVVAEAWKEFFEEGGVPCRIWSEDSSRYGDATAPCNLYVPNDRWHVVKLLETNC